MRVRDILAEFELLGDGLLEAGILLDFLLDDGEHGGRLLEYFVGAIGMSFKTGLLAVRALFVAHLIDKINYPSIFYHTLSSQTTLLNMVGISILS